jgi:hypothetical protein
MTGLLGHVIGRFDFETRSEQGSNRRPPISCPSASREVEGRLGAFYLARTPNDPLARHPLGKKIPLAIRLRGRRGEGGLVSEARVKSLRRALEIDACRAIGLIAPTLVNLESEIASELREFFELLGARTVNNSIDYVFEILIAKFAVVENRFKDFGASQNLFVYLKRVDFAREGNRGEEFALAQIPLFVIKNRVAYREFERIVDFRVYEVDRAIFVALIVAFETRRGASPFNMERPNIKPQDAFSSRVYFFNHFAFLVLVARLIPIDAPSLIDFLGIGKKIIVIRQKKSRAFRLAIAPVGIRLARARNFLAGFRRARLDALDLRRDDLRDFRAFFLREDFDDLRAALASFPDSFEEREGTGEFLLHLRERVLFRDALRLKSVDHRGAPEVIDFDFVSIDFSFHFSRFSFFVEALLPSTLLDYYRSAKASRNENGNSFASTYDLARVELRGFRPLANSKPNASTEFDFIPILFSTLGTRIIHSYNRPRQLFIRREGKNSADSKTSFKAPSARLGASNYPKSPSFRASNGFSTILINRISSFNSQRRGAAFSTLAYSLIKTPISTSTYSSTFTSSLPSTLASTLSSSITSTLFVNSVDVPITRT